MLLLLLGVVSQVVKAQDFESCGISCGTNNLYLGFKVSDLFISEITW